MYVWTGVDTQKRRSGPQVRKKYSIVYGKIVFLFLGQIFFSVPYIYRTFTGA